MTSGEEMVTDLMKVGFFTYPWDLMDDPEGVIREMAEELGCNAIMLNAQYHHARLLRPREDGPKTFQTKGAVAAFWPNADYYQEGGLSPVVDDRLADLDVVGKTGRACNELSIDFGIWVVGLHNSSLGRLHPELCMENCFGDIYTYALCPRKEENRIYLIGLVKDVCQQFNPDRVAVEAVGYLSLRHWDHHELFMVEWDQALELLTGICFCDRCVKAGEEAGIDVGKLRGVVSLWAEALLNEERGSLPESSRSGDIASLLMEIDGLRDYLKVGEVAVTDLAEEVCQAGDECGVEVEIIPASFHRPSNNAWMERASIKALAVVSDRLMVSSYFISSAEVEADLTWLKRLAGDTGLSVGLNACAPTPNASVLDTQVRVALEVGAKSIYYYNYGLLTRRRLDWVKQVNDQNFG